MQADVAVSQRTAFRVCASKSLCNHHLPIHADDWPLSLRRSDGRVGTYDSVHDLCARSLVVTPVDCVQEWPRGARLHYGWFEIQPNIQ